MRGNLDGQWFEIEECPEHRIWLKRPGYFIKDDPERGLFEADDFDEIEA
jgi:hypothetical protein